MKKLSFVIGLKKSYDEYESELIIAQEESSYEYFRFLKTMKFYDFIDQILTACTMYPRSIDMCRDNVSDLAYVMYRSIGMGIFYLTTLDQSRLTDLILRTGNEVISVLDAHHYYLLERELPRTRNGQRVLEADLVAIPNVKRIGAYSFQIEITENNQDDDDSDITIVHNLIGRERPKTWSF